MLIRIAALVFFAASIAHAEPETNADPTAGKTANAAGSGFITGANPLDGSKDANRNNKKKGGDLADPSEVAVRMALVNEFTDLVNLPPEEFIVQFPRLQEQAASLTKKTPPELVRYNTMILEQLAPAMDKFEEYRTQPNHQPKPNPNGGPTAEDVLGKGSVVIGEAFKGADPENPKPYAFTGQAYAFERQYDQAFANYGGAIERGDHSPNTYTGYGTAAFNLGDYDLAQKAARKALEQDASHFAATSLFKLSQGRVSKTTLPSSLAEDAGRDRMMTASAGSMASLAAGGSAGASAAQAQAAQLAAGSPPPPPTAAEVAAAIQRQMSAEAPPSQKSAALTKEAATYLRVDDYSGAYAMATKAIELNEKNAQAYTYRAMANNGLGRFGEGASDASTALGLVPGNAVSLQTRSASFLGMGRYQDALADANHTLEKQQNGQAYYNRAFALAGMGDRSEVLESLRAAAQVDPKFQPIYQNALQMPDEADMLLLFKPNSVAVVNTATPLTPEARRKRFIRLMALTASGGLLVALGLLHVLAPTWRDKLTQTVRRVIGAAPEAGGAQGTPMPTSGFWSGYTVSREIGIGGMGVVYEATDNSLSRRVAIKKMRDEIRLDPQERRRFVAEARTVASLHHPHIVDIYAIVEDDSDVYLVFEFIDGKTLSELVKEGGPMSFEGAREVMKGVCGAVDFAHRNGVIHRDIKPSNIMVSQEGGHVKVMDFGVARQAKEAITKMAQTNTIVGTPPYMAPEQEQGSVRRESDVFALGVCYYELITGKLPFSGQGAGMLLNKINGRHIPASQVRQGLPAGLDDVMAKALCPDPDKRYKTAAEFLAALEGVSPVRTA